MIESGGGETRVMMANTPMKNIGTEEEFVSDDVRKSNLKKQKREYKNEKKRVAHELITALQDPTVVVMGDWLKVRGTLRKWNRYYCVLKPGLLLIYKSTKTEKHGTWVGTILLNTCELIERPSKKDGFCFKLFHPLDQSIWTVRGPLGESHGAVTLQPLPSTHLICRAVSEQAGRSWMDALELSLRCSGLLMRTMHKLSDEPVMKSEYGEEAIDDEPVMKSEYGEEAMKGEYGEEAIDAPLPNLDEKDAEKHFDGLLEEGEGDDEQRQSDNGSEVGEPLPKPESLYINSEPEQMGSLGDAEQTEEVADENKSLVWTLLKQVRPGMDLSRVVLPTFILEPRSFLEKLADYYYHVDLLARATSTEDPCERMIEIVKFYLSGFYKKPRGLKKPYNPILGETFRCSWRHPDGSITYYIAEQVSHHPPISSIFVTNRQAGFNVSGTILAKSKYYGNSLSAMMIGAMKITLLKRHETYTITLPYANCKGLLIGTLTMEFGGQVKIECNRTAYSCNLEFKLKPFIGGSMNGINGKVKLGSDCLAEIDGFWDGTVNINRLVPNKKREILWKPTPEIVKSRLPRFEIPLEQLGDFESRRLWSKVSVAIANDDQIAATNEKFILEQGQRQRAKDNPHQAPKYFQFNAHTNCYDYIHADYRPWDPLIDYRPWDPHADVRQLESNYVVRTETRRKGMTKTKKKNTRPMSPMMPDESPIPSDDSTDVETVEGGRRQKRKSKKTSIEGDDRQSLVTTLQEIQESLARIERLSAQHDNSDTVQSVSISQLLLAFLVFGLIQCLFSAIRDRFR